MHDATMLNFPFYLLQQLNFLLFIDYVFLDVRYLTFWRAQFIIFTRLRIPISLYFQAFPSLSILLFLFQTNLLDIFLHLLIQFIFIEWFSLFFEWLLFLQFRLLNFLIINVVLCCFINLFKTRASVFDLWFLTLLTGWTSFLFLFIGIFFNWLKILLLFVHFEIVS